MDQSSNTVEMPRYKCHKEVHALKIADIIMDGEGENRDSDGSAMLTPAEEGYAPFRVEHEYMRKHKPEVGGYCVVYEDGYTSFSPAEAFEGGYKLIGGGKQVVSTGLRIVFPLDSMRDAERANMEDDLRMLFKRYGWKRWASGASFLEDGQRDMAFERSE